MSYEIAKEGSEFNDIKLGQKCILEGEEYLIIGFDTSDPEDFIAIEVEQNDSSIGIKYSVADYILEGKEDLNYKWANKDEITLLPFTPSDDSLPSEISPVHVADILEDVLGMDMDNEDEQFEIRCIINKCIKSLRQHN